MTRANLGSRLFAALRHRLVSLPLRRWYRLTYAPSRIISKAAPYFAPKRSALSASGRAADAVFVVDERNRGWILDAIAREIASRFGGEVVIWNSVRDLPPAQAYFISHYSLLPPILKRNPHVHRASVSAWYTHPRPLWYSEAELTYAFNMIQNVFCQNSWARRRLLEQGVRADVAKVVLGAADPNIFRGHMRGNGVIGFSAAFYERKKPMRVLEITRAFPDRKVVLLGRGWQQFEFFDELCSLPNFRYIETSYAAYPQHYAEMDVFVSPAILEGGPIPLLEAMMCNAVPVASDTGFARDLIDDGKNGYIFDVDAPTDRIVDLIGKAFVNRSDIRRTVQHLTWDNFAAEVRRHMISPKATFLP